MAKSNTQTTGAHTALLERLKKASRIEQSDILADSKFFNEADPAVTDIPMLNVALSGQVDDGLRSGLLTIAGPSKHFKTLLALICIAAYMKKHPTAVCMFYDSEFGAAKSYFEACGVDPSRVLHNPIENIEVLKFDIINQLTELKRGEKVVFFIDSIGNLASKKEVEDAIAEKSVADMTRAKALKGLFRMVTPFLSTKDVPMIAINHSYQEIGLYPKTIMSGGTGILYSSNIAWIMGRRQDKDADGIQGYHFIINVEKSRMVREKSQIPISVTYAKGLQKYTGLLDIAIELGFVTKPSQGFYQSVNPATNAAMSGKLRADATNNSVFWDDIFTKTDFAAALKKHYQLGTIKLLHEDVATITDAGDDDTA